MLISAFTLSPINQTRLYFRIKILATPTKFHLWRPLPGLSGWHKVITVNSNTIIQEISRIYIYVQLYFIAVQSPMLCKWALYHFHPWDNYYLCNDPKDRENKGKIICLINEDIIMPLISHLNRAKKHYDLCREFSVAPVTSHEMMKILFVCRQLLAR